MTNVHKNIVKLATALVKYHAEKALGDDALSIVVQGVTNLAGESAVEKISSFLDQGEQANRLIEAFKAADICFTNNIDDAELNQMIISKPMAGLEKLETFAASLPETLDDDGLLYMIQNQFEVDWHGKISGSKLKKAALVYRRCLDRSLATKMGQILQSMYRSVERIEKNTLDLKEGQQKIYDEVTGKKLISEAEKVLYFRANLVHVISELKEWETRYAPMFAKFEKLTLFAQVKSPSSQPEPLLNLISRCPKLVILGPAGSGKTTTTQKVTLEYAQNAFRGKLGAKTPIFVPLRDYGEQNLRQLINTTIKFCGLSVNNIEDDLSLGELLLVFDGLNEIPIDRREVCFSELRNFLREFPTNRYIFTSRTLDYQDNWLSSGSREFPVCEIQGLTKGQIESYIFRYFKDQESKAESLINELELHTDEVWENRKSLARLAGVPLLLQMTLLQKGC